MRGNLPGPEGLARRGASAALHGLPVVTTTGGAARLASAPSPCQRGSRRLLRQAPGAVPSWTTRCPSWTTGYAETRRLAGIHGAAHIVVDLRSVNAPQRREGCNGIRVAPIDTQVDDGPRHLAHHQES